MLPCLLDNPGQELVMSPYKISSLSMTFTFTNYIATIRINSTTSSESSILVQSCQIYNCKADIYISSCTNVVHTLTRTFSSINVDQVLFTRTSSFTNVNQVFCTNFQIYKCGQGIYLNFQLYKCGERLVLQMGTSYITEFLALQMWTRCCSLIYGIFLTIQHEYGYFIMLIANLLRSV